MIRVIRADIGRILRKKRIYIFFVLGLLVSFIYVISGVGGLEQVENAKKILNYEAVPLNCLLVYLTVFSEEFHTGTMQCVIGRGYSRNVIVVSKFADCVLLLSWYFMWFYLGFMATNAIDNFGTEGESLISMDLWLQLLLYTGICVLKAAVVIAFTMIVLFLTWSVPVGMLFMLFTAMLGDITAKALQGFFDRPVYIYSANGLLEDAYRNMVTGEPGWQLIPALALYIALPLALTGIIFNMKEVEL